MSDEEIVVVAGRTEDRNPATEHIDSLPALGILTCINDEDARVAPAVRQVLPDLAELVEHAVRCYEVGGTIHYVGAGTSGRIGVMDAAELPPTYSVPVGRVVAHHAGGSVAVDEAVEGIEDHERLGRDAVAEVRPGDVVIGIAASGRTPYVAGALLEAKERGALTALVSANEGGPIAPNVDIALAVNTGPEVIAGSTRMKAGTAQKLVLNAFSTALMIRLGKTYSNLMVDVSPTNAKLRGRVLSILMEATGQPQETCAARLEASGGDTKVALISLLMDVPPDLALVALQGSDGRVRAALAEIEEMDP